MTIATINRVPTGVPTEFARGRSLDAKLFEWSDRKLANKLDVQFCTDGGNIALVVFSLGSDFGAWFSQTSPKTCQASFPPITYSRRAGAGNKEI
jgi:hypothetical protein